MSSSPVIDVQGVWTRFGEALVHRDIDLVVHRGEMLGLVGGSGSGKTTLLREVVGLLKPTQGEVRLFGKSVVDASPDVQRDLRRRFGMLFQHGALFSALPVFDNIAFPLRELKRLDEDLIRELVWMKLAMVELEPAHGRLMPAELSGGMIKRVALARALALEPELLVLDEPTSGLDPDRSENFVKLIRTLQRELNFTVIMVTHDLDTLAGLANRVAAMADQRIVALGTLQEVMAVDHPFVHRFFGGGRGLRAQAAQERAD
ncbi:MAG: phospholipid/cholesterol/gamma-HCH transport system ATP-binding protein [Pseudomonadota bacterium]|nr:phospholipid/cholesterol/gamma-HCH transport system ATP-binding protein [Pseudomonadota bacterium]MDQ5916849.1 phospholipid/cholesterol/gamma-HCH transport system ATP-binding protein [Pseudomonadota bacterium]MDQ5918410.1 phospholipid/cholesterol/gamma-HCH transport system ATP-binding protein [Pseudomonadota bacterium]MDQ5960940.1 phospholipid/cholesterol/gamma-HCH transport system ATP-binding protein [Pseudomonadota bacterium]